MCILAELVTDQGLVMLVVSGVCFGAFLLLVGMFRGLFSSVEALKDRMTRLEERFQALKEFLKDRL
jgi:hypothetical protein